MENVVGITRELAMKSYHEWQAKATGGPKRLQSVATHAVNMNDSRTVETELTIHLPLG